MVEAKGMTAYGKMTEEMQMRVKGKGNNDWKRSEDDV